MANRRRTPLLGNPRKIFGMALRLLLRFRSAALGVVDDEEAPPPSPARTVLHLRSPSRARLPSAASGLQCFMLPPRLPPPLLPSPSLSVPAAAAPGVSSRLGLACLALQPLSLIPLLQPPPSRLSVAASTAGSRLLGIDRKFVFCRVLRLTWDSTQNEEFWRIRDQLERNVSKAALIGLLEHNSQGVPSGESNLLDRVADAMLFGALAPCAECKAGQLAYSSAGYKCTGMLSEWAKCLNVTQTPKRVPFKVPAEYHDVDFLKNYKCIPNSKVPNAIARRRYKPAVRLFPKTAATAQTASSALVSSSGAGSSSSAQPLSGTLFKVVGKHLNPAKKDLESSLKSLGAVLTSTVDAKLTALISSQKDLDSGGKDFDKAKAADVHVVSEAFVAACSKGGVSLMVKAHAISSWGGDVEKRLDRTASRGASDADKLGEKRKFKAQTEKKIKVQVKDGSAVDPDSGVADRAAIVRERGKPLNAIAWSRSPGQALLGVPGLGPHRHHSGGNKLQSFSRRDYAIENFLELFEEKTGNNFFANEFKKLPNRFFPVELDYGQEDDSKLKLSAQKSLKCKLAPQVQQLLQFIFDIDSMKQTMLEFEIDLKKMPLGKISKRQIREAYSVLTDLSNICSAGGSTAQFLEASTRFYSLIPHDFGMRRPPMLDTQEIIKAKLDMLDNLLEIEVAYSMIKSAHGGDGEEARWRRTTSSCTLKLRSCRPTLRTTNGWSMVNIFKVRREGEEERFKPFKKLPNRKLLWHGSRRTNWAGILSQ
uniref:Poly [ADP-ribose] polymerase n=1 Tax=Macrostomum lignano TaxID=282301 RepID=A0A1I8IHU9_9PLAT